jgi:phosphate transport system permease protein
MPAPNPRPRPSRHVLARTLLAGSGLLAGGTVLAIFAFLIWFSLPLFTADGLATALSWSWRPTRNEFGILPMALGSLALSAAAFALAYPLGVGVCLFACGLGPRPAARLLLAVVRFMTGIPTVVYGFAAAMLLTPLVRSALGGSGYCWLTAALTLALLALPTIVLLLHARMEAAEAELRLTAAALGLDPAQKLLHAVLPACGPGLFAAAVLGFGRTVGDTLIPLMLAGNAAQAPHSLAGSLRTLTAHIALVVATDSQSAAYASLFACGLILFLTTLGVNLALRSLRRTANGRGLRPEATA